jgi:hypothetical protein
VRPALLAGIVDDPRAAAMLAGEPGSARRLGASLLVRSARSLAERLLALPGLPGLPAAEPTGRTPEVQARPQPEGRRLRSDPATGVLG